MPIIWLIGLIWPSLLLSGVITQLRIFFFFYGFFPLFFITGMKLEWHSVSQHQRSPSDLLHPFSQDLLVRSCGGSGSFNCWTHTSWLNAVLCQEDHYNALEKPSSSSIQFWKQLVNSSLPLYQETYSNRGCPIKFRGRGGHGGLEKPLWLLINSTCRPPTRITKGPALSSLPSFCIPPWWTLMLMGAIFSYCYNYPSYLHEPLTT